MSTSDDPGKWVNVAFFAWFILITLAPVSKDLGMLHCILWLSYIICYYIIHIGTAVSSDSGT